MTPLGSAGATPWRRSCSCPPTRCAAEFDAATAAAGRDPAARRRFKVSTLVVLRRLHDIGAIGREAFHRAYEDELGRLRALGERGTGGGNFHHTEAVRVSRTLRAGVGRQHR